MDWDAVKVVLDFVSLVLAIGAWGYAWWVGHRQAQKKEIDGLKELLEQERGRRRHDFENLTARLTRAEARLDDAPTGKALHEVAVSIERLSGDLRSAVTRMDGMDRLVQRLEAVAQRQEDYIVGLSKR
jgi:uncharacterized protein HemX